MEEGILRVVDIQFSLVGHGRVNIESALIYDWCIFNKNLLSKMMKHSRFSF